jgi:hypothetical protein
MPGRANQGAGLLGGLGRACYRHRWITLFTWIIGVACLIVLWLQFGAAALNTFNSSDPGETVLNQHFPRASGDTLTLAVRSTAPITSPATGTSRSLPCSSASREPASPTARQLR